MTSRVRIAELSVVLARRDARHGMDYDHLESHLVAYGPGILSVIVTVCSSVRMTEDRCHGLVLEIESLCQLPERAR